MPKRTLVTTSDERSWPEIDEKILFLGSWCIKHNQEHILKEYDIMVMEPFGISLKEKSRNNQFISSLINEITFELANELNKYHGTNYSIRYWNILFGHWLQRHIKVIFNRYKLIELSLKKKEIDRTIRMCSENFSFIPTDTLNAVEKFSDDEWNHNLFILLLSYFPENDIKIIDKKIVNKKEKNKKNSLSLKRSIKKILNFSRFFIRNNDGVILDSYLPGKELMKLFLYLGQFPVYYNFDNRYTFNTSTISKKRDFFFQDNNNHTGIEFVIRDLIKKTIPFCFLEGYKSINEQLSNTWLPKYPKFIFTSNAFSFNEYFKFWTAKKTEEGVKYFVGQHGSNYGTLKGSEYWPEVTTCDSFLSWGWDNIYDFDIKPCFNFKITNIKQIYNPEGSALLVKRGPGHATVPQDHYYEHQLYQNYVFDFFEEIDDSIKTEFIVRLHHGSRDFNSSDFFYWSEKYPNIELDDFNLPFYEMVKKSRIVVFSYECSGFLECLSLNIPTICFWRGDLSHMYEEAAFDFRELENAELFTNDALKAASQINANWSDIQTWWNSDKVQDARIKFCKKYSRVTNDPLIKLAKNLLPKK